MTRRPISRPALFLIAGLWVVLRVAPATAGASRAGAAADTQQRAEAALAALSEADEAQDAAPEPAPQGIVATGASPAPAPASSGSASPAASLQPPAGQPVEIGFDLVPFLGTSGAMRGREVRKLSFNLIGGLSGAIDGVELGGAFNIVATSVHGFQGAGWGNFVGGPVDGVQLAGVLNTSAQSAHGLQGAGVGNLVAAGGFAGMQGAGVVNVALGDSRGVQGAGVVNVLHGRFRGVQAAGVVNVATQGLHGLQAGVVNLSLGDVRGLQLGLVNVAKSADASLGLLSVIWDGTWDLELNSTDSGTVGLAVRNGARRTHSFVVAAVNTLAREPVYALGLGVGVHGAIAQRAYVDFDLIGRGLHRGEHPDSDATGFLGTARATLAVRLFDGITLYAGPTYNVLVSEHLKPGRFSRYGLRQQRAAGDGAVRLQVEDRDGNHHAVDYDPSVWTWLGVDVGIRFAFGGTR